MTPALSPILISRLEKAATDNGFDQALDPEGDWLVVASTQCPLRVWLGALSLNHVLYGLATRGAFEAWRCP